MKFLIIYGNDYREVEADDWWEARRVGARLVKEEMGLKLPLGLIEKFLRVVKVGEKYKKSEFKELI
jgi:hypothetical protein